jgi:hypothetical protein
VTHDAKVWDMNEFTPLDSKRPFLGRLPPQRVDRLWRVELSELDAAPRRP